jgi:hypothetical protein
MNTTTQEKQATNDLRHSIVTKDAEGNNMYIKIRLNDECHNGHQDFSITCDIYEKGKPKTDRYHIMGGCCHDEILKALPELKQFVDLHLCDYKGIPMHATANGFYHLRQGFNNTKPEDAGFVAEYCDYYRMTREQFAVISQSRNELQFALNLEKLGILAQWEKQANEAIKTLEEMTGKTFLVDSVKTQYYAPTPEAIREEEEKQKNGYYTPEAQEEREKAKAAKLMADLIEERDKKLAAITEEYDVKMQVLSIGGKEALKNCIFYNHTRTLAFNWMNWHRLSDTKVKAIAAKLRLPEGIKIEFK